MRRFLSCCVAFFAVVTIVRAADPAAAIKFPAERKAWDAIAARFKGEVVAKHDDRSKVTTLSTEKLKAHPMEAGTASVRVNAEGHVTNVTANVGNFGNDEFAIFAAFPELDSVTLWHNYPIGPKVAPTEGSGEGLLHLVKLPKLTKVTLAGGSLNDAGMAAAAKLPHLKELHIWHARFTDAGVEHFRKHPTLEVIKIGPMFNPDLTDKSLEALSDCPKLRHLQFGESYLTWEGGLKHLEKRKDSLAILELGSSLINPADVEKVKTALPNTKVTWDGLGGAGQKIFANGWTRGKAEKWMPKELLKQAEEEAAKLPKEAKK